jgi:hypothetical protein
MKAYEDRAGGRDLVAEIVVATTAGANAMRVPYQCLEHRAECVL